MTERPIDPNELKHGQVYLTHTNMGNPGLLISPQRLKAPPSIPGWFAIYMEDERELYKFAATLMNKADDMRAARERGELPELPEERDYS